MTTPLVLLATAVVLGSASGGLLARARWAAQAPRLAAAMWHALSFSTITAAVLGNLALMEPLLLTGALGDFLARCANALHTPFATPTSPLAGGVGLVVAATLVGRLTFVAFRLHRSTRRDRQRHLEATKRVGQHVSGPDGDRVVLLDDRPAAYCLPNGLRRGTIVISSGSISALDDGQLRLVLAHERAHLRQRHHMAIAFTNVMVAAFAWVPLFRAAAREVPSLLEMAADDHAIRLVTGGQEQTNSSSDARRRLAHALLSLATAQRPAPSAALPATGGSAIARVRRLSQPPLPLGLMSGTLLACVVAVVATGPTFVASAPALCAAVMSACPFV